MKPELRKLSLYWDILTAASQSSTELKVVKSGMDLSNNGWDGLEKERERESEIQREREVSSPNSGCSPLVYKQNVGRIRLYDSHSGYAGNCFKAGGVADEFVKRIDDIREAWPSVPIFLPAVEHQLVESSGTVHGGRQPVILLYSIDHLHTQILLSFVGEHLHV